MNLTKSSSELKANAREKLLGSYGKLILALVVMAVILRLLTYITESLLNQELWSVILYYLANFLVTLFSGILVLGQTKLYMNFTTGRKSGVGDLFYAIREHQQNIGILLALIQSVLLFVCMLPFSISLFLYYMTAQILLYPVMALTLIAGLIIFTVVYLSISQGYYISVDFPDYTLKQVLLMSIRVMKGHRARLFYLLVSFLPLILLCILSFGIGFLWLSPYMQCTLTCFYLDLMAYHTRKYTAQENLAAV